MIKGRKIDEQSEPDKEGKIKVQISGDVAFTKAEVLKLLTNDRANQLAERIVSPLATPGVDTVRFKDEDTGDLTTLQKTDMVAFAQIEKRLRSSLDSTSTQENGDNQRSSTRPTRLWVLEPSFIRTNKWMVAEGENKFYVDIKDDSFLDLVEQEQISFTAHTALDVILTQTMSLGRSRDSITYTVEKVQSITKGPEQRLLFN